MHQEMTELNAEKIGVQDMLGLRAGLRTKAGS